MLGAKDLDWESHATFLTELPFDQLLRPTLNEYGRPFGKVFDEADDNDSFREETCLEFPRQHEV